MDVVERGDKAVPVIYCEAHRPGVDGASTASASGRSAGGAKKKRAAGKRKL